MEPQPTKKDTNFILSRQEKVFIEEILADLDITVAQLKRIQFVLRFPGISTQEERDNYCSAAEKGSLTLESIQAQLEYHEGNRDAIASKNYGPLKHYTMQSIPAPRYPERRTASVPVLSLSNSSDPNEDYYELRLSSPNHEEAEQVTSLRPQSLPCVMAH